VVLQRLYFPFYNKLVSYPFILEIENGRPIVMNGKIERVIDNG